MFRGLGKMVSEVLIKDKERESVRLEEIRRMKQELLGFNLSSLTGDKLESIFRLCREVSNVHLVGTTEQEEVDDEAKRGFIGEVIEGLDENRQSKPIKRIHNAISVLGFSLGERV